MTHPAVTLTDEECAALDELIEGWYRQALHLMQSAYRAGEGTALPPPLGLPGLDAYRPHADLVSR